MSDINDLIHTNAKVAFDQGVKTEQQRILTLIESVASRSLETTVMNPKSKDNINRQKLAAVCYHLASLIKGEKK